MKNIISSLALLSVLFGMSGCRDLTVERLSLFDDGYVFSSEEETFKALLNVYSTAKAGQALAAKAYECPGSDIEIRPEFATWAEFMHFYPSGTSTFLSSEYRNCWEQSFKAINVANLIIEGMETANPWIKDTEEVSSYTQMYGEAITLRATCYRMLTLIYGDVPFLIKPTRAGDDFYKSPTSRWEIQDYLLDELERVEKIMMWADQIPQQTERIGRGYTLGLIARIALQRGGYTLMPEEGNPAGWGTMKRDEANWKSYYKRAHTALKVLIEGEGAGHHRLLTADSRTNVNSGKNGIFSNPYQLIFQDQMDYKTNAESLWELAMARDNDGDIGYTYARAHPGASSNDNSSKQYGGIRAQPTYYYNFDPKDLRRDVTATVSYTTGGVEKPYQPGAQTDGGVGGISLNKWDKIRMVNPTFRGTSNTGINQVYMRLADMILLMAECETVLAGAGEGGYSAAKAKELIRQVRSRAFAAEDQQAKVTDYLAEFNSPTEVFKAVVDERGWELFGERVRKFDLVRWNTLGDSILSVRKQLMSMTDQIRAKGYCVFPTGLEMADTIYVKSMSAADMTAAGYTTAVGLTYGCPVGQEDNPLLHPGWRGIGEAPNWAPVNSNLAMKGVFKHLTEAEKTVLRQQGYKAEAWGATYFGSGGAQYSAPIINNFSGYTDADKAAGRPARYLMPYPGDVVLASKGKLVNQYGLANQ
ncbi:MAG: RagB/SusD family nutrient uptake outer membrane protein [Rikenellaceae bacterium]|jgi:hypothetical protein|nr:RagB/SusD family nutrient uptake outer membrane protein [Rikenellaceae bacterium]